MGADAVPTQRSGGPSGVLHIVREVRPADPYHSYDFVVSFGGYKDPVGAIVVGKAVGPRELVALLQKLGVSDRAARLAAKELLVQHHHVISGMTLTTDRLRQLGV